MEQKLVTVITHKEMEIQTLTPALPDQFGYVINHPHFAERKFDLVQEAIEAIDDHFEKEEYHCQD